MPVVTVDGRSIRRPGVPSTERVVSTLPGAQPDYRVPVILAAADFGVPYTVRDDLEANETPRGPFVRLLTDTAAADAFGRESDMAVAMQWAKRGGLPMAYCVCLSSLTRASVLSTSTGPVVQAKVYPRAFGFLHGHVKLKYASNVMEVTPVRYYTRLTANASTSAKRLYVKRNDWIRVGATVTIGDGAAANETAVVAAKGEQFDTNGQKVYWIDLATGLGTGRTTAQYAVVLDYDEQRKEVSPATLTTGTAIVTWLNESSRILAATVQTGTFTDAVWIAVSSATALKDISAWGTVTDGTSPAVTTTDMDDLITALRAVEWDAFVELYGVAPQAFLAVTDNATMHASLRDFAIDQRGINEPVSVTTGAGWADIDPDAGDTTNPAVRAATLNSQDVLLTAGGIDYLPSYLSFAPFVFGRRLSGDVNHNITNDPLVYTTLQVRWDERNSGQITYLLDRGVCVYALKGPRFVIEQGLSTLQDNDNAWNTGTNDTPLIAQRDVVDFVTHSVRTILLTDQIGADVVTPASIADAVRARLDFFRERRRLIADWFISSIGLNASGAGYDVAWGIRPNPTVDYIPLDTTILIGE